MLIGIRERSPFIEKKCKKISMKLDFKSKIAEMGEKSQA